MTTFLALLFCAAFVIGGGFLTYVSLHLFVPLVVRAVGKEKFVEMSGLEPCGLTLFSGIAGGVLYSFAAQKWGALSALLLFPLLSLLCVCYAILWLKTAATGKTKREFEIRDGQIVRCIDAQIIRPTYVKREDEFRQTDAYHFYSFYGVLLCDESGILARNVYLSKLEKDDVLRAVLECGRDVPCRALDLTLVCRKTEKVWWQIRLGQENAALLCGALANLHEENRSWWRQWLRPQFAEDGFAEIAAGEAELHFAALKAAYPNLIPDAARTAQAMEELETQMVALDDRTDRNKLVELSREYGKLRGNDWIRVEMLLQRNAASVELMTQQRFEAEVKKVAPNGATLMYGSLDGHENLLAVEIKAR